MPQVHETAGRFAILSSTAKMPSSCRGRYRWVAVVELAEGFRAEDVKMVSERAKAVARIVWASDEVSVWSTPRSAFGRAHAEALEMMTQETEKHGPSPATLGFEAAREDDLARDASAKGV